MFGFLPEWVGDTLTIIAVVLGTPGIILWLLNRKEANRRLEVDEGGLTVAQFNAALPAYKDLLDRATKERDAAADRVEEIRAEFQEELDDQAAELDIVEDKLSRAIRLIKTLIARAQIELTPTESLELEEIRRRVPRSPKREDRKNTN